MAIPNIPVLDLYNVEKFSDFDAIMKSVTTTYEAETMVSLPDNVSVTPGPLANSLSAAQVLQPGVRCISAESSDNPPMLLSVAIAAAKAGGAEVVVLFRTQHAPVQTTIEYLWRSSDNGGLRKAGGLVILPTAPPLQRSLSDVQLPLPRTSTPDETTEPSSKWGRRDDSDGDSSLGAINIDVEAAFAKGSSAMQANG